MFKKPPLKPELDELLEAALPKEMLMPAYKAFWPVQAAHAWLIDSKLKFNAADVIALAGQIGPRFPH